MDDVRLVDMGLGLRNDETIVFAWLYAIPFLNSSQTILYLSQ